MPAPRTPRLSVEPLEARDVPSVAFPAGSNVVDVAARYGATPGDGLDDSAAVQRAVNDYMARDTILYFRDGVYDFTVPIDYAPAARGERGLWIQGESQGGTVFKWGANLPVFNQQEADGSRKNVVALDTFNGNNGNAFGNYLHDFTVEVGAGNPGAVGIQYQTNNYGSLRNVTIRSADPAKVGATGLDIIFNEPGPMLLTNLAVDGFDTGVFAGPQTYSAVFDGLTLTNQRVAGFQNYRLPVSITNFTSINSVPAYVSISSFGWGNTVITNANFSGGAPGAFAVVNENNPSQQFTAGNLTLRNVSVAGYAGAVDDRVAGRQIVGPTVAEYVTQAPLSVVPGSPATTLNLPVEATPAAAPDPVSNWASVTDFGANPYDDADDSAAIQRALDSGAKTVYFPNPGRINAAGQFEGGTYRVGRTLTVGGGVERVAGLYSSLRVMAPLFGADAPVFRVVDGQRSVVQIDGFTIGSEGGGGGTWYSFGHDTATTLVIKDVLANGYRNGVRGGKVFFEDVTGSDLRFVGQQAWLRQINPEETADRAKIVNDGGDVWILGLKTEGRSTAVDTRNGGRTEVLGGNLYHGRFVPADLPAFTTVDSSLSFSLAETSFVSYPATHNVWVRDTRNGVVRELTRQNAAIDGSRLGSANIGLYTDRVVDATAPAAPANLRLASATTNSVTLSWDAAAEPESFVRAYRVYRNGTPIGATGRGVTTFTDANRPDALVATYDIVAENAAGLRSAVSPSLVASAAADTTRPALVVATATPYLGDRVVVAFNESLAGAAPADFAIDNGVTVAAALLSADGKTVTLTTSPLTPGTQYTVTALGLRDRATTPNALLPTAAAFAYRDTAGGTGLTGTYYPTNNFTGTPVTRLDPAIDFDWGGGSPGVPGIGTDNFSVRWTGQVEPKYGEAYTFALSGDDGVRLTIDGRVLIDRPFYSPNEETATITLVAGRRYDIEVTVFENAGGAGARLSWQSARQPKQVVPAAQLFPTAATQTVTVRTGAGRGADSSFQIQDGNVQADYFANNSTSGSPVLSRLEGDISTFWGGGGPGGGVPNDNFSVRYTGFVLPQFTEDYTFSAIADDRVRLWVNDVLVLNRTTYAPGLTDATPVRLTAGVPARVRAEFEEDTGDATAALLWRSARTVQDFAPFLRPEYQDNGGNDTLSTYNRLNFSFFEDVIGLKFDLSGVDRANFRVVDSALLATLAGGVGDESAAYLTIDGTDDATAGADWAESGPDRRRWATFPGNQGSNYAFGGPGVSSFLGYAVLDNTGFRLNAAGRDGVRFQSDELTRFVGADTDGLVTLMVRRTIPNFFGNINIFTKEYQGGTSAPGLRLTLAPKVTAAPLGVDLLPGSDTGASSGDDITARNNSSPGQALRFRVGGTAPGAVVTVYLDGVAVGSAVATGDATEVLTFGGKLLADGVRSVTARQTVLGVESADSVALAVTVDTGTPSGGLSAVAPNPRTAPVDAITVTFTEAVTGLDLGDFTLNGTALNLTAATLSGGGGTYTLGNLAGLTGAEGGYSLALVAAGSGVADAAGNQLLADALSRWAVDLTAPRPAIGPVTPAPRNTPLASIGITFSEPVTGLDLGDIALTLNGTPVSLAGATLTGSGDNYTLANLAGLTGAEGDYGLTLNPAGSGIADAAGNELVEVAVANWTTDTTAPTGGFAAVVPDPRTTPVPSLALTFSEAVAGLDLGDLQLTRNGAAVDLAGATLGGSGAVYTLAGLSGVTGAAGSYVLSVRAAGTGIADAAGNPLAAAPSAAWTVVGSVPPRVASITRLDANPTNAGRVRFAVAFTEAVTGVDATDFAPRLGGGLAGASVVCVDGSGSAYTVTVTTGTGSGTLRLDVTDDDTVTGGTGTKLGGTGLGNGNFRKGETYTIDRVAPRATGISSVAPDPRRTPVDSLTVTFSEALNATTLDSSDLTLRRDGGPDLIGTGVTITQTGPRSFRIDGLTALTAASGRYAFTVDAAGVTDVAGNAGSNSLTRTWTREAPRVTGVERADANPTNAGSVAYRVTLSEAVTGLDAADFRLVASSGLGGTGVRGVTALGGGQYLVTVNTGAGSGTLRLDFAATNSGVLDSFGNAVVADFTRGQVYAIDRTPPTVRSILGAGSAAAPVPALTVTFSESIRPATFTTANLVLRRNGVALNASGLRLVFLSPTAVRVEGLDALTADAGAYEFGVDLAGLADLPGNVGTGLRSIRWTKA